MNRRSFLMMSGMWGSGNVTGSLSRDAAAAQVNMTAALVPANPRLPIAYLGGGFEFYAGVADTGLAEGVQPDLTGGSLGDPDSRSNPAFAVVGDYPFDAREHHRRAAQCRGEWNDSSRGSGDHYRDRRGDDSSDRRSLRRHLKPREV
jgi:hypothetical protein